MSSNNLRILDFNIVNQSASTVTASSVASASTPVSNLKLDIKSAVWRSGSTKKAILIVTRAYTGTTVNAVVLPFTNLSSTATIRIRGVTGTIAHAGTLSDPLISGVTATQFDTGFIAALPYLTDYYRYGDSAVSVQPSLKPYARVWLSTSQETASTNSTSFIIEINDLSNPDTYLEISRIIIGSAWSPKYNTSYGINSTYIDNSTSDRSESGDLLTTESYTYKALSFDLGYMDKTDRQKFNKLIRSVGSSKPIFISAFPDNVNDYEKEQTYHVYGKLKSNTGVTHHIFDMYNTSIEIEEV